MRLQSERLTVGPPERLPFQPGSETIAVSGDGQTVAQAQYAGYVMAEWAGGWVEWLVWFCTAVCTLPGTPGFPHTSLA